MPFPWAAVIGAAASIGGGLLASSSTRAAASASKKDAKKTAKDQYKRAKVEFEIQTEQDATNYTWDLARTEANRWMDKQRKADYESSQLSIYEQAIDNLTLNTSALLDKYKWEESLRAAQVISNNEKLMDETTLGRKVATDESKKNRGEITAQSKLLEARSLSADTQYDLERKNLAEQAALNAEKSNAAVKQYLSQVKDKRAQGQALVQGLEDSMSKLLAEQANEMSIKQLERNIRVVASMMDQGAARATAGRTGGSSTSRRLAMNEAQKLGRTYGEIQLLKQQQGYQMQLMNSEMQGEQATQLTRLAQAMQNDVDQSKSVVRQTRSQNKILQRRQESIFAKRDENISAFKQGNLLLQNQLSASGEALGNAKRQVLMNARKGMRDLEIETQSFPIGARQGQRELTGLYINTDAQIDQASQAYRDAIIFDPLEPIEGLPPEKRIPSFSRPESPINSYANAIMGGVQTALNFSTMTSDGLKFY